MLPTSQHGTPCFPTHPAPAPAPQRPRNAPATPPTVPQAPPGLRTDREHQPRALSTLPRFSWCREPSRPPPNGEHHVLAESKRRPSSSGTIVASLDALRSARALAEERVDARTARGVPIERFTPEEEANWREYEKKSYEDSKKRFAKNFGGAIDCRGTFRKRDSALNR